MQRWCRVALHAGRPPAALGLGGRRGGAAGGAGSSRRHCSQHIVRSQSSPCLDFPAGNYTAHLFKHINKWPERVALKCSLSGQQLSYAGLRDQTQRWGGYLRARGLGAGDVIAVIGPNLNEYAPVLYGSASVGAVFAGINPTYTAEEMAFQLSDSDAKLVVAFGPLEQTVREALSLAGKPQVPLVAMGPNTGTGLPQASDVLQDENIPFADPAEIVGTETFAILYSSGTTGKPKGTLLSHNAVSSNIFMVDSPGYLRPKNADIMEPRTFLQLVPLFHSGGLVINSLSIHTGRTLVNYPKFDPASFVKVVRDYKITDLPVVPAVLNFIAQSPACDAEMLRHVRSVLCGTAPLAEATVRAVLDKVQREVNFQQGYGMTELLFATIDPYGKAKMGFTGQLLPGMEAKVVDLHDPQRTLGPGEDGEIYLRTPSAMTGYLNQPEESAATLGADGWLRTGDVSHYDDDAYFRIVDRNKDLIKVKGFQVSPTELEEVLGGLAGVREAAVVGVPDPRLGEAPRAFVVAAPGCTAEQVAAHVAARCAPHKHLKGGVEFVETLPRNATGKVLRRLLR